MRHLLAALMLALGIVSCATTSSANLQTNTSSTPPVASTEARFPVMCVTPISFNAVTGHRNQILYFDDTVGGKNLTVHVDTFQDGDQRVTVIYHTLINNGVSEVCILHVSPADVHFMLEGIL